MGSSDLFESDEDNSIQTEKYFQRKSYKVGVIILGSALFFGLFILPFIVNDELPSLGDLLPVDSGSATSDFQKNFDEVKLTVGQGEIFYFNIVTNGKWSGDYVDGLKVPKGIFMEGDKKFPFRCFYDEMVDISTYFGTFRGLEGNPLLVEVLYGEVVIDERISSANQAIVLEGSC